MLFLQLLPTLRIRPVRRINHVWAELQRGITSTPTARTNNARKFPIERRRVRSCLSFTFRRRLISSCLSLSRPSSSAHRDVSSFSFLQTHTSPPSRTQQHFQINTRATQRVLGNVAANHLPARQYLRKRALFRGNASHRRLSNRNQIGRAKPEALASYEAQHPENKGVEYPTGGGGNTPPP